MATVTLSFDEAEIKKLITERVEIEYQRKVIKVDINVSTHHEDRGGGSYPVFKNIEVKLGDKIEQRYGQNDR